MDSDTDDDDDEEEHGHIGKHAYCVLSGLPHQLGLEAPGAALFEADTVLGGAGADDAATLPAAAAAALVRRLRKELPSLVASAPADAHDRGLRRTEEGLAKVLQIAAAVPDELNRGGLSCITLRQVLAVLADLHPSPVVDASDPNLLAWSTSQDGGRNRSNQQVCVLVGSKRAVPDRFRDAVCWADGLGEASEFFAAPAFSFSGNAAFDVVVRMVPFGPRGIRVADSISLPPPGFSSYACFAHQGIFALFDAWWKAARSSAFGEDLAKKVVSKQWTGVSKLDLACGLAEQGRPLKYLARSASSKESSCAEIAKALLFDSNVWELCRPNIWPTYSATALDSVLLHGCATDNAQNFITALPGPARRIVMTLLPDADLVCTLPALSKETLLRIRTDIEGELRRRCKPGLGSLGWVTPATSLEVAETGQNRVWLSWTSSGASVSTDGFPIIRFLRVSLGSSLSMKSRKRLYETFLALLRLTEGEIA